MSSIKKVNKDKIARSFLKGKLTYDSQAKSQQRVSRKLVDKVASYPAITFSNVLEIGCCTGILTELIVERFNIEKLYLNDLVSVFQKHVENRVSHLHDFEIIPMFGDIEQLDFPENLDLVISSATFQWLSDINKTIEKISHSLLQSGHLAFSIFGPGTLCEFREITGIGLEYLAVGNILDMLERDFHVEEEETVKDVIYFSSPKDVLRHLQATGVGGVTEYRWTPSKIRDFEKKYYDQFGNASGVPVTYISSYIIASKKF